MLKCITTSLAGIKFQCKMYKMIADLPKVLKFCSDRGINLFYFDIIN